MRVFFFFFLILRGVSITASESEYKRCELHRHSQFHQCEWSANNASPPTTAYLRIEICCKLPRSLHVFCVAYIYICFWRYSFSTMLYANTKTRTTRSHLQAIAVYMWHKRTFKWLIANVWCDVTYCNFEQFLINFFLFFAAAQGVCIAHSLATWRKMVMFVFMCMLCALHKNTSPL